MDCFLAEFPLLPEDPVINVIKAFNETSNVYTGFHLECSFLNITHRPDSVYEVDWLLNDKLIKNNTSLDFNDGRGMSVLQEDDLSTAVLVEEVSGYNYNHLGNNYVCICSDIPIY